MIEFNRSFNILNELGNTLFNKRGCDGSKKEYSIYQDSLERVQISKDLINNYNFEMEIIVKNLDEIINSIKALKERKYVNYVLIV